MKIAEIFGGSGYDWDYDGGHRRHRHYKKRYKHKYHWRGHKRHWYRYWC